MQINLKSFCWKIFSNSKFFKNNPGDFKTLKMKDFGKIRMLKKLVNLHCFIHNVWQQ
jgi:hypothetical protein